MGEDVHIGRLEFSCRLGWSGRPMNIDEIPAGPELDALVAERVMGFVPYDTDRGRFWHRKEGGASFIFHPSLDIAAAWEVLLKAFPKGNAGPVMNDIPQTKDSVIGEEWVILSLDYHDFNLLGTGPTAPLAICRAALKSMGVK